MRNLTNPELPLPLVFQQLSTHHTTPRLCALFHWSSLAVLVLADILSSQYPSYIYLLLYLIGPVNGAVWIEILPCLKDRSIHGDEWNGQEVLWYENFHHANILIVDNRSFQHGFFQTKHFGNEPTSVTEVRRGLVPSKQRAGVLTKQNSIAKLAECDWVKHKIRQEQRMRPAVRVDDQSGLAFTLCPDRLQQYRLKVLPAICWVKETNRSRREGRELGGSLAAQKPLF